MDKYIPTQVGYIYHLTKGNTVFLHVPIIMYSITDLIWEQRQTIHSKIVFNALFTILIFMNTTISKPCLIAAVKTR